jgi:hypothetical protein
MQKYVRDIAGDELQIPSAKTKEGIWLGRSAQRTEEPRGEDRANTPCYIAVTTTPVEPCIPYPGWLSLPPPRTWSPASRTVGAPFSKNGRPFGDRFCPDILAPARSPGLFATTVVIFRRRYWHHLGSCLFLRFHWSATLSHCCASRAHINPSALPAARPAFYGLRHAIRLGNFRSAQRLRAGLVAYSKDLKGPLRDDVAVAQCG